MSDPDFNTAYNRTFTKGLADDKPIRLVVEGLPGELIWLTAIGGGVSPNYQIMYSIGARAFINTFNQKLSMWTISGLYIPGTCEGAQDPDRQPPFVTFYNERNIVNSDEPIRITFNNIVITGFLVNLEIQQYDQEGIDGHRFTLKFLGKMNNIDDRTESFDAGTDLNRLVSPPQPIGGSVLTGAASPTSSDTISDGKLTSARLNVKSSSIIASDERQSDDGAARIAVPPPPGLNPLPKRVILL